MIERFRSFMFMRRHLKACRALARSGEERRKSFEVQQFNRRRAAALKHTRATQT